MHAWNRLWMCLPAFAFAASSAVAQPMPADPDRRPYVTFDIDQDVANKIKNRLKLDKDMAPFKELVRRVLADPKGLDADFLKKLDGAKLNDEKLKKAFQNLLNDDPALRKGLQEWIKKNQGNNLDGQTAQSLKDLEVALKDNPLPPGNVEPVTPAANAKPKDDATPDDKLAKAAENTMEELQKSPLGDWLKNSPAWQRAFSDLRSSIDNPHSSKTKLGDWSSKLLAPDGKTWKLSETALGRLKNLPRPDLEHWTPKLPLPGLGKVPTPSLNPPTMPAFRAPSLPSFGVGATWLLLAALCLLAGWQMTRWSKRSPVGLDMRARLGPWPVKPNDVATRADLVQAFDYLAILTLGLDAKSWNHHAIARRWSANAPANAPIADVLARLYEQARYTESASELTQAERDGVRQALLHLAETR